MLRSGKKRAAPSPSGSDSSDDDIADVKTRKVRTFSSVAELRRTYPYLFSPGPTMNKYFSPIEGSR